MNKAFRNSFCNENVNSQKRVQTSSGSSDSNNKGWKAEFWKLTIACTDFHCSVRSLIDDLYCTSLNIAECKNSFLDYRIDYEELCHSLREEN